MMELFRPDRLIMKKSNLFKGYSNEMSAILFQYGRIFNELEVKILWIYHLASNIAVDLLKDVVTAKETLVVV